MAIIRILNIQLHILFFCFSAANVFYVRCGSPEQAKTLSNVKILGDGKVLSDSEEKEYWTKANQDREEKLGGKIKVKSTRLRGKDKVFISLTNFYDKCYQKLNRFMKGKCLYPLVKMV